MRPNESIEFPLAPGIQRPYKDPNTIEQLDLTLKKVFRSVPFGGEDGELTQLECGCWTRQAGLYVVMFRPCDRHSLGDGRPPTATCG